MDLAYNQYLTEYYTQIGNITFSYARGMISRYGGLKIQNKMNKIYKLRKRTNGQQMLKVINANYVPSV